MGSSTLLIVTSVERHGAERTRRRVVRVLWGLVDVAAAAFVALLVFRTFGAVSGVDTNPPECFSTSGQRVSCSLTPLTLMLPTFAVVLLGLAAWRASRRRRLRAA